MLATNQESNDALRVDHQVRIALDYASVRVVDEDGHLHVSEANVCKECVSPYFGGEIPDYEKLGLDPRKIYKLYRPAEELEKAVRSANGKPVLRKHIPTSADDHQYWDTIGASGTTARWEAPYIKNGLVIWPGEDIEKIDNDAKREISPGYRYKAVMEPSVFDGEDYDGRMTNIAFNHFAIVEDGRQGEDVVIGDGLESLQWEAIAHAIASLRP